MFRFCCLLPALLLLLGSGPAVAAAPLASLLIGHADLRTGYREAGGQGYVHTLQIPDGSPISARVLQQHGYVISYVAQFTDYGAHPGARRIVGLVAESGDKYRTVAGARWGYRRMVHGAYPQSLPTGMPRVGDESSAFTADLPEPPGKEADIFFRHGRYVVRIAVAAGTVRKSAVLALARLIDSRIHAAG